MTLAEIQAQVRADTAARIKAADDEALLAAKSFAFGQFDRYWSAKMAEVFGKVAELEHELDDRFGTIDGAPWLADPADLGKPVEGS